MKDSDATMSSISNVWICSFSVNQQLSASVEEYLSEIKQLLRATLVNMPPKGVITGVSIDSRTCAAGDLFIAIPGENFDGHDYIDQAVVAKCAAIVVEKRPENVSELNACMMIVYKCFHD